jgi:16S rRNA (adenine1518-N6/adenine1519-N6)-dimethyltransferase
MSSGSSRNQTLSFILHRFKEAGLRPRGKLGQNFLTDLNLVRLLVAAAELGPDDVVLEIGTGTGSLTALLAEGAGRVITVELDQRLHQLAAEELDGYRNVRLLQLDALKNKNRLNAAVLAVIDEELGVPGRRFKLAANLPYNVATPILTNLLALDRPPASMTVTVQKEVADRLAAAPGTKDYGSLSIWVQSQCRVEIVRVLPPSVFWPRPKVHSAIVQVVFEPERRARIPDRAFFHNFSRAMFLHRRKFLRSELATVVRDRLDKPDVDRILAAEGLDGQMRAEQLSVDAMLSLCERVRKEMGETPQAS